MARLLSGRVVGDKNDKTIVVSVSSRKTHPIYKKQYTINRKFMAHDQKNEAKVGDLVVIRESRPLSAKKHFTLHNIAEKSGVRFEETDATADVVLEEQTELEAKSHEPKAATKKLKANSSKLATKATKGSDR